ncbi:hypothetical protein ACB092_11G022100 [Castanea dentata]
MVLLKTCVWGILMPYNDIYALGVITIQLITKRANVIGPNYKHVSTIAEEYKESGHVLHQTLITSGLNQLEAKRITKLALSLTPNIITVLVKLKNLQIKL